MKIQQFYSINRIPDDTLCVQGGNTFVALGERESEKKKQPHIAYIILIAKSDYHNTWDEESFFLLLLSISFLLHFIHWLIYLANKNENP